MRVAFTLIGGAEWTGGRNYLLNLLTVLCRYEMEGIQPVLFAGADCPQSELEPFSSLPQLELVRDAAFDGSRKRVVLARGLVCGRDDRVLRLFERYRIDLVFEAAQFFGWRLGLPVVGWIPDFQHRVLPQLFSPLAMWKRELGFRVQALSGRKFMLSSDDAREACERFYPATRGRTATVRFAIAPTQPPDFDAALRVAQSYGLGDEFFFIPNQFWRHKNHLLVVEALAMLRARGHRCVVATSGYQNDPRFPDYFSSLTARIVQLGVVDDFRLLGVIPYKHIAALLRVCTALCNPSLFEGWSTTVEEARLLGTPMILSDLAVHQEQMGMGAIYFDRHSPLALADCLMNFKAGSRAGKTHEFERAQREAGERARAYAAHFVDLARSTVDEIAHES